ncbi:MAG: VTT domain-containing protein [Myxococcales bacterium]|nr:VTT domain-containing protein [Myxococcales bacterium]MCB9531559.1 VTT domain-containing protein [Myxococcales bacterium]MCB9532790.1 VTT domain-containing protein [Myxococcales bacterium]
MILPPYISEWLSSYPTLFLLCVICGFPVPFPEDIIVMTVGTLVARGELEFGPTALVCGSAMFIRDLNAFLFAKTFSHWLVERPRVRAMLGERNIERWSHIFEKRGGAGVFFVRFAVGTRVKLLFIAAALGVPTRTFVIADILGMVIVTPLLLWLGASFGEPLINGIVHAIRISGPFVTLAIVVAVALVYRAWKRAATARPS